MRATVAKWWLVDPILGFRLCSAAVGTSGFMRSERLVYLPATFGRANRESTHLERL